MFYVSLIFSGSQKDSSEHPSLGDGRGPTVQMEMLFQSSACNVAANTLVDKASRVIQSSIREAGSS